MKMNHKPTKCCTCQAILSKTGGQKMELRTDFLVQNVKRVLVKDVQIGDILCSFCRTNFYKKKAAEAERDMDQGAGPSHASTSQDPDFHVSENIPKDAVQMVEINFPRVVSTHKYCFLCSHSETLVVVPFQTRQQIFSLKRIFVPKGNRLCFKHLIKDRIYKDELENVKIHSAHSSIEMNDLTHFLDALSSRSEADIVERIGDYSLSEERIMVFTGLKWENIEELNKMLKSLRNSHSRNVTQALVTFLFKLRTGNSNRTIAAILGLQREQQVSEYCQSVIKSFEKDVLPLHLGFQALSRDHLIANETSMMAKSLLKIKDQLALIFDGTYVHHEKSANNEYQRRSYSGQKKKPLCKPFTVVTTSGYIVDTLGPFSANLNDATIMEQILQDPNGLTSIMQPGDIWIVDRGFRDVVGKLQEMQFTVMMPALKGNRKQLTTSESNESRYVTKVRWAVEAIHGIIGEKYHLLHQQVDNKLLPNVASYCRIVSFLNNKYGKRLGSDTEDLAEIVSQMESRKSLQNSLATQVETERLSRRKVPFQQMSSADMMDFPEMTAKELKIFFTGSYQLKQAVSYLAEIMDSDNNIHINYLKETPNIVKMEIRSRHIKSKTYRCYIDYLPNSTGSCGIKRYCCECANGNRTIGCCSHVAAVIYYLSHARYLAKIVRPAAILSKLFLADNVTTVINEDSDED